jgi:hypothetical protein
MQVKARALRVEMARQSASMALNNMAICHRPGGATHDLPSPILDGINDVHRAHRACWAAQQQLQFAETIVFADDYAPLLVSLVVSLAYFLLRLFLSLLPPAYHYGSSLISITCLATVLALMASTDRK